MLTLETENLKKRELRVIKNQKQKKNPRKIFDSIPSFDKKSPFKNKTIIMNKDVRAKMSCPSVAGDYFQGGTGWTWTRGRPIVASQRCASSGRNATVDLARRPSCWHAHAPEIVSGEELIMPPAPAPMHFPGP